MALNFMKLRIDGESKYVVSSKQMRQLATRIFVMGFLVALFLISAVLVLQYQRICKLRACINNMLVISATTNNEIQAKDCVIEELSKIKAAYVTLYSYNSLPEQTDSTPEITAIGRRVGPGQVAVSPDLLKKFPYGTKVWISKFNSVYEVTDCMNTSITNSIDVWQPIGKPNFKHDNVFVVKINASKKSG